MSGAHVCKTTPVLQGASSRNSLFITQLACRRHGADRSSPHRNNDSYGVQPLALAPLQLPVDPFRAAPPLTGFVPNQAPGAPVSPIPVRTQPPCETLLKQYIRRRLPSSCWSTDLSAFNGERICTTRCCAAAMLVSTVLLRMSVRVPARASVGHVANEQEESGEWLRSSRATAATATPPRSTVSLSPAPGSLVDSLRATLVASTATGASQLQQSPPAAQQQQQGADDQGAEVAPGARRRAGSPPMIQLDSIDSGGDTGGDPFVPGQPHAEHEAAANAVSARAANSTADSVTMAAKTPEASPGNGDAAVPADTAVHTGDAPQPGGARDGSPPAATQPPEPAAAAVTTPPTPPQPALRGSAGPGGNELADDASSVADNPFEVL